jgi:phosphoribosylanthranilate isomerase
MRVKICGITQVEQAEAIAQLGATALGFVCVPQSPRYVTPAQIAAMNPAQSVNCPVDRIGVFVEAAISEIEEIAAIAQLSAIQLHGQESIEYCQHLKATLPQLEIIKAFRVRDADTLAQTRHYEPWVNTLLLDAYQPHVTNPGLLGGTGKTLDWDSLTSFRPGCGWLLAGGLTPDNVEEALQVQPDGIDLSSGVEISPGNKDLAAVTRLFDKLQYCFNVSKKA